MIINRIYEHQNLLCLQIVSFLVGLRTYQHPYMCLFVLGPAECNRFVDWGKAGRFGVRIHAEAPFVPSKYPHKLCAPPSPLFSRYRFPFAGVRLPGYEGNHSPPSSAEVKNVWSYTSTPPICLQGVDRDNFTFYSFFTSRVYFN
jgi:hypothetical protein